MRYLTYFSQYLQGINDRSEVYDLLLRLDVLTDTLEEEKCAISAGNLSEDKNRCCHVSEVGIGYLYDYLESVKTELKKDME